VGEEAKMNNRKGLDCVVIGYNEIPFERYEKFLRSYGQDSEAYRDLKFSFVDVGGVKMDYPALLNHVWAAANNEAGQINRADGFKSGEIPNLAAVYLTNFLRRRGYKADYVNLFQYEKDRLAEYLDEDPVCVAITTTFYVVNLPVIEMVEFIRDRNSKIKIIVGGPLIANHARSHDGDRLRPVLEDTGADIFVIEGSGELTLAAVVACLKNGGDLAQVPNLAYIEDSQFVRTAVFPENNSLDDEMIDWRGFNGASLGPTLQTRTARSCAFNCAFCNYPTRAGKLTLANISTIEKELDSMRQLGSVENVVFIDDTFNVPLPRFKEMCRLMISKNYGFNWFSYFRCSNSDEEAIDLMAQAGCKGVFLGIESGSPEILKNMNKAATVEKYIDGMEMLHQHGILTFGSFIIGFPGETDKTVQETADFIKLTKPHYYRAQSWYCEPGTPIDRQREKYDIKGDGFVWSHATMESLEAMDHIERLFLTIDESLWLPQWSFDFWISPYLIGRGISAERFRQFMTSADELLALDIAVVPEREKKALQKKHLEKAINVFADRSRTH
jgi:p-methyltransferase